MQRHQIARAFIWRNCRSDGTLRSDMGYFTKTFLSATLLLSLNFVHAADPAAADRFGFGGPEIFPIDPQISLIRSADLNGDGLVDLVVANNARSKINLLINQTGKTNAATGRTDKPELNQLPADARFRIESIASEKRISSLVVADLNCDSRPDLVYYGEPRELVIQYNEGTNGWTAPKRFAISDGLLVPDALAVGDLNGDGRPDLVLLGENVIYFFPQKADHTLGEPERIPYTGTVKSAQVLDIDGDGKDDLLLVNWESADPFRFRLQNGQGQLGPEIHFALPPIRSYMADDLDHDHKAEMVTIAMNSGRAQISNFIRRPAEALSRGFSRGQLEVLPLAKISKARRGSLWADINCDGLPDFIVADPDSAQLSIYLQQPDGTLAAPMNFPTLTGVTDLAVCDWDGDGVPEIFLLSGDERQVGVTRLDKNGKVAFPTIIPCPGTPLVMAAGALHPKEKPSLAIIADEDGKRVLLTRTADGHQHTQKLDEKFKANPASMLIHDVNQDGMADLVILVPYEKIKILLQNNGKAEFTEVDVLPPGGGTDQPWASLADVEGDGKPELLLAQKNFLRAVVLRPSAEKSNDGKPGWSFVVKEQINGASSQSRITAAAALRNGTNGVDSLFLLDAQRKALTLCERDHSGVWQAVGNITLPVTDFNQMQAIGLGSPQANNIALLGTSGAATMRLQGNVWQFNELDGYETPIRDGRLTDVISGDLNSDGRKDLVFLETARNYLDLVTFEPPHKLVPANRWQVFEERTFRSRRNDSMEPREALVADVTGDGKNDLIVLVHDRILVYPQE